MHLFRFASVMLLSTCSMAVMAHTTESLNYNVIQLQAEANRKISNDEMHAVLYIEKNHKQPAQLATDISQLMNQAMLLAQKYPAVKIETGSQTTYPIYDNDNQKLKEWRGRAEVRLESADFKAASQLVTELQKHFQTESISFSVSDQQRKKVENELIVEASKNFQQRAQALTTAWHKSSYQLVSLNVNSNNYQQPIAHMVMMKNTASADASMPEQNMAAGESEMTVNASGEIQLK